MNVKRYRDIYDIAEKCLNIINFLFLRTEIMNRLFVKTWVAARHAGEIIAKKLSVEDKGMATAEYAIVLVAASSFAGLLVALLKSDVVRSVITKLVTDALSII